MRPIEIASATLWQLIVPNVFANQQNQGPIYMPKTQAT
jgi:hypothetical protein